MTDPSTGRLRGIRVVEFTHMIMGPSCAMDLGDVGADVVKIEPKPDCRGCLCRWMGND